MAAIHRVLSPVARGRFHSFRVVCSQLPNELKEQSVSAGHCKQNISTTSIHALKVLNESTILVQDGVSIKEFPVLVGRADRLSFPFTSHSYTGESIREVNEFEKSFKQVLQDCATVSDVFKLLEVPSDRVQGYSAAFALQRLHALMYLNTEWLQIHSFIRTAVMRELYETVQRDVQFISNPTLIGLVDCYLAAPGFSPSCVDSINDEISHRLVAGVFSVEELLCLIQSMSNASTKYSENIFPSMRNHPSLSEILFENASKFLSVQQPNENVEPFDKFTAKANPATREKVNQKCSELLRNAWVHLSSRYQELHENTLPLTMHLLPMERKNFVRLLERPVSTIWYHLSAEGTAMCLDNLLRLRIHNSTMMTHLGRWSYVNVHLITPPLLLSFLNVYIHFTHIDKNFIRAMERCLQKTGSETQTDLLALCVEYLRSFNYISPVVMDLAADHFTKNWQSYAPLEIYAVLRAFGHLRYLPRNCQEFLKEAEECLHKRFDLLDEVHLLEVLASFTFVDVLPKNFYRRVTNHEFFQKIGNLPKLSRLQARLWLKAMQHAVTLASSTNKDINRFWVLSQKNKLSMFFFLESERVAIRTLKAGMNELFGPKFYHFIPFYSCCAIYVNDKGIPLEVVRDEKGVPTPIGDVHERLVIILRTAAHFSSNTNQLLGAQAQKKAHLDNLGFTPVEIHVPELHCLQPPKVIQAHLLPHIDFSSPQVCYLIEVRRQQREEEVQNWSFNFQESTEDGDSSGDEGLDPVSLDVDNNVDFSSSLEENFEEEEGNDDNDV